VPRAGEAGGPVADSDDQISTIDAPISELERRGRRSLMEGKGRVAAWLQRERWMVV
jgi:hypothetical protein